MSDVVQHQVTQGAAINLTDKARQHVLTYLAKQPGSRGIRFSVKKTGCSGLSYLVDFIEEPRDNDVVLPLFDDYLICIDKASYPFLKGMSIDYVRQGLNEKFVFDNPNQTGQCGCGESFTVE